MLENLPAEKCSKVLVISAPPLNILQKPSNTLERDGRAHMPLVLFDRL